jgi:hypothetical protein
LRAVFGGPHPHRGETTGGAVQGQQEEPQTNCLLCIKLAGKKLQEAPMCHHGHIKLSPEDKKDVKKLSGIMIPVYATAMVALIAFVAVTGGSRQGQMVASTAPTAAAR